MNNYFYLFKHKEFYRLKTHKEFTMVASGGDIVIVHIFTDEKFFDNISDFFDLLPNVKNRYLYYSKDNDYKFEYIKQSHKIELYRDFKLFSSELSRDDIDIVYFHSLPPAYYHYLKYIPKKEKIIWWAWGYDIYFHWGICPPLIKLPLYKPQTLNYIKAHSRLGFYSFIKLAYRIMRYFYDFYLRRSAIKRIDYFSPVIPTEYDLLRSGCRFFHAKPFMLKVGPGYRPMPEFRYCKDQGNILIGNSLTFTNNHLDIFKMVRNIRISDCSKYIIPINYGSDFKDIEKFKSIANLGSKAIWLDQFIPYEKYMAMLDSCSYAIFGVIRQQAMGNIRSCLNRGIKVFLYKDSIVYKDLKQRGYKVFPIEDIDDFQLNSPLSKEDAYCNYMLDYKQYQHSLEYCHSELVRIINDIN